MDVYSIAKTLGITLPQRDAVHFGQMIHRHTDGVNVVYNMDGTLTVGDGLQMACFYRQGEAYAFTPPGENGSVPVASLDEALAHWPEAAAPRARDAFVGAMAA